jgi:hypothetical protein
MLWRDIRMQTNALFPVGTFVIVNIDDKLYEGRIIAHTQANLYVVVVKDGGISPPIIRVLPQDVYEMPDMQTLLKCWYDHYIEDVVF